MRWRNESVGCRLNTLDAVRSLPRGARFFRADLHIHSFSTSHDVRDPTMTPAAIIDTAISEGIGLIAITDHNEIVNVAVASGYASGREIVVIPAVELSTSQGHLLSYAPTVDALQRFGS